MNNRRTVRSQSGFNVVELLVVVAMIGIISLITVPNFVAIQRGGRLKNTVNTLTSDLRMARAIAVTERTRVRVSLDEETIDGHPRGFYTIWRWNAATARWDKAWFHRVQQDSPGRLHRRDMQLRCFVDDVTGLAADEITFRPDGTIEFPAGVAAGRLRVVTDYENVPVKEFDVSLSVTGQIRSDRVS